MFCKMQWMVKSEIISILYVIKGLGYKTWLGHLIMPVTPKKKKPLVIIVINKTVARCL